MGEHKDQILNTDSAKLKKYMWMNLKEEPDDKPGVPIVPAGTGEWQWMMLNLHWDDIYSLKFTRRDYYRIAKFSVKNWGADEGGRVRSDVLSPKQYYTVCKIMANQGVLWGLDYEKLQKASNFGISNPVVDIILTVSDNISGEENREVLLDYLLKDKDVYSVLLKSNHPKIPSLLAQLRAYATELQM